MTLLTVRAIFAMFLAAGCIAIALARISHESSSHQLLTGEEEVIPLIFIDGKKCFIPIGAACGNGFSHLYQSLDGVKVGYSGGRYTERIERAVQRDLKEGIIIERGPIIDDDGQVIGERTVFLHQRKDTGRQVAIVWSTVDDGFTCIDGESLEHVLNLEKWQKRHGW
jgi:hypothetical protein